MLAWRMLWKDWGFASALFAQATYFLGLAKQSSNAVEREGCIRACIVFLLMSFEAYFLEITKGYIQRGRTAINPEGVSKVEDGLQRRVGIHEAVRDWPKYLTGNSLDTTAKFYTDFVNFTKYRNALVHSKITEGIPSWGKLAQEVETIDNGELARETTREMVKAVAVHFRFDVPTWIQ